ncbi:MAG: tRNA uridine-5-carboxymethylaminomethyl(34) synthesis GTPase MnmE [Clostridiales bacterium]|nr:tRNA uridine-5-carboxymethylaminomethyl(34) synthesis GTPase MnmE [Clostridiales bacterium]
MSDIENKPFCACSTPGGVSGIAVIRMSGKGSFEVCDKIFKILRTCGKAKNISDMEGYTAAYAKAVDPNTDEKIDDCIVTVFRSPNSYTGEDMVEISCHGGVVVKQEILRVLTEQGGRAALPGEFTKTAFLNGKLDLTEAEAVMNVIAADSERALKASNAQLGGALKRELKEAEDKLYEALSLIEMMVEFPEHDDTPENTTKVKDLCVEVKSVFERLKDSYEKGRVLSERMRIALCGLPNSGKSSLLNSLTGYDRAIVTEVAGTTRDTLEVEVNVNGIPVTLIDTAGIRETDDKIEAMGVERAKTASFESDLTLYLAAPDVEPDEILTQINELLDEGVSKSSLAVVFSKSDLGRNSSSGVIENKCREIGIENFISVSSVDRIYLEELKSFITDRYENLGGTTSGETILLNKRHAMIISESVGYLNMGIDAIDNDMGLDAASSVLRLALDKTGEITGKSVSSELVDNIFSRFCIGK